MSFGDDEDILQDFLVEAGEILERLSQQLVDLEQRPEDKDLLNAIFRGFHTVKGGAGFLALTPMVECCHLTENLFDILRNGKRAVTSELMDVVLEALDLVNQQFELVSQREALPPVDHSLIAALERLVSCADLEEAADAAANENEHIESVNDLVVAETPTGDITDAEFEQLLDAIAGQPASTIPAPVAAEPVSTSGSDEITEDEFDALLDQLHGKGSAPGIAPPAAPVVAPAAASSSNEITEDEFEALLDQLHGKGKGPAAGATAPVAPVVSAPAPAAASGGGELISDDEFDALLDQLHGKGKGPGVVAATPTSSVAAPTVKAPEVKAPEVKPAPAKPAPVVAKKVEPTKPVAAPAASPAPASDKEAPQVETTVRVDTQRLDDIMNMVGELVLVRNRLVRLGNSSTNEALVKAVANLDVVTADLQTSVMKTRMQPIKKVFGRFPRVVRDLAR
ncbi:MAG TPA: Hpt domain-containing protein, partial [Cellvibrio sp.]